MFTVSRTKAESEWEHLSPTQCFVAADKVSVPNETQR